MNVRRQSGEILEKACLFVLLAVVGVRPLIAETNDSAGLSMSRALEGIEDPSPANTLIIDGIIMLAAVGWLVGRALRNDSSYRWSGMEWGAGVVAVAAAVSCVFSGNRRLAINGAVDWLSCVLLSILLVQLLRDRWRVRLALCVILASAAAQAAECFHQAYWVFDETEVLYAQQREEFWSLQRVALDSDHVELFEARMGAREASGYLSHANVAGAYLVMCGLSALALSASCRGGIREGASWLAMAAAGGLGALMLFAATLTSSRGALVAGGVAVGLYALRVWCDDVCERHRRALFRWGWAAATCLTLAVVAYGMVFGSLPGRSLGFRWRYWTASAQMVIERPLTGVGSGNFGRHYLKHKTIDSPEEIQNPHNFLVAASTDWGPGGAVGLLMMIFGVSRIITSGDRRGPTAPCDTIEVSGQQWIWWGLLLAAGIFGPRVGLLGSDDPNYRFFATMMPLFAWVTAYFILVFASFGSLRRLGMGIGFALLGLVLQDTINFASLVPGTLTTTLALVAVVVSGRYVEGALVVAHESRRPIRLACLGSVAFAVLAVAVVAPVQRSVSKLRAARRAGDATAAVALYDEAARLDPLDSRPLFECAGLLRYLAARPGGKARAIDLAIERIDGAIKRDRFHLPLYREKSKCHSLRAELTSDANDLSIAIAAAEQAVRIYPTDPANHELLGNCLAMKGWTEGDTSLLGRAIQSYRRALAIDDARPDWERIRRLRQSERESLLSTIRTLEGIWRVWCRGCSG